MADIAIRNEADAYQWLEAFLAGDTKNNNVVFEGWPNLVIRLTGDKFKQSITPTVMKGFIDLQGMIYKSYAVAKYGTPDTRKLSKQERDELELKIVVEDGSSIFKVDFQELLVKFVEQVGAKMEPKHVIVVALGLGTLWAGNSMFNGYLDNRTAIRQVEVKSEEQRAMLETLKFSSKEETRRLEVLEEIIKKEPILDNVERIAHDAKTDLIKSLSKADTVEIQGTEIDGDVAKELVTNARRKSSEVRLDGYYRLQRVDSSDVTAFKVKVRNVKNGLIIDALVQDDSLSKSNKEILQYAEWERTTVFLKINAKELDGEIKDAVIVDVIRDDPK